MKHFLSVALTAGTWSQQPFQFSLVAVAVLSNTCTAQCPLPTTKPLHRVSLSITMSALSSSVSSTMASTIDNTMIVIDLLDDDSPDPINSPTSPVADLPEDEGESVDAYRITATSQHTFPSYDTLRQFMIQYAAQHGFEVRCPSNKGSANQSGHAGSFRCWCYLQPPITLKYEQQQQPSHPPLRTIVPRAANRSGNQVKCGCTWRVNFSRHADGDYVLTANRTLRHSGHECMAVEVLATSIDSLSVVPADVRRDMCR